MSNKTEKTGNSTNNSGNAESNNNVYRLINKTDEQLNASAQRYNERAECGQIITFEKAEQKKAVGNAANADSDGYLAGIFWSGYVVTTDGQRHDFERLDSNGISRHFADVCTWKRATRATLLDGNSTRTDEQRADDAVKAIADAKAKPADNSVTALLWALADEKGILPELHTKVMRVMATADANAAEKAKSKESKTAKAQRELEEAKQAAAAAEETNRKMIEMLLATGQYANEQEIREKLGI